MPTNTTPHTSAVPHIIETSSKATLKPVSEPTSMPGIPAALSTAMPSKHAPQLSPMPVNAYTQPSATVPKVIAPSLPAAKSFQKFTLPGNKSAQLLAVPLECVPQSTMHKNTNIQPSIMVSNAIAQSSPATSKPVAQLTMPGNTSAQLPAMPSKSALHSSKMPVNAYVQSSALVSKVIAQSSTATSSALTSRNITLSPATTSKLVSQSRLTSAMAGSQSSALELKNIGQSSAMPSKYQSPALALNPIGPPSSPVTSKVIAQQSAKTGMTGTHLSSMLSAVASPPVMTLTVSNWNILLPNVELSKTYAVAKTHQYFNEASAMTGMTAVQLRDLFILKHPHIHILEAKLSAMDKENRAFTLALNLRHFAKQIVDARSRIRASPISRNTNVPVNTRMNPSSDTVHMAAMWRKVETSTPPLPAIPTLASALKPLAHSSPTFRDNRAPASTLIKLTNAPTSQLVTPITLSKKHAKPPSIAVTTLTHYVNPIAYSSPLAENTNILKSALTEEQNAHSLSITKTSDVPASTVAEKTDANYNDLAITSLIENDEASMHEIKTNSDKMFCMLQDINNTIIKIQNKCSSGIFKDNPGPKIRTTKIKKDKKNQQYSSAKLFFILKDINNKMIPIQRKFNSGIFRDVPNPKLRAPKKKPKLTKTAKETITFDPLRQSAPLQCSDKLYCMIKDINDTIIKIQRKHNSVANDNINPKIRTSNDKTSQNQTVNSGEYLAHAMSNSPASSSMSVLNDTHQAPSSLAETDILTKPFTPYNILVPTIPQTLTSAESSTSAEFDSSNDVLVHSRNVVDSGGLSNPESLEEISRNEVANLFGASLPGRSSSACNFPAKRTIISSDAVSTNNGHSVRNPTTLLNICRTKIVECLNISSVLWPDSEPQFQSTAPTFDLSVNHMTDSSDPPYVEDCGQPKYNSDILKDNPRLKIRATKIKKDKGNEQYSSAKLYCMLKDINNKMIPIQRKFNSGIFKDVPNPKLRATQKKLKLTKTEKETTTFDQLRQSAPLQCSDKLYCMIKDINNTIIKIQRKHNSVANDNIIPKIRTSNDKTRQNQTVNSGEYLAHAMSNSPASTSMYVLNDTHQAPSSLSETDILAKQFTSYNTPLPTILQTIASAEYATSPEFDSSSDVSVHSRNVVDIGSSVSNPESLKEMARNEVAKLFGASSFGLSSPAFNFPAKQTVTACDAVSKNNGHSVNNPSTLLSICRTEIVDCLNITSLLWLDLEPLFQSTTPTFDPSAADACGQQIYNSGVFSSAELHCVLKDINNQMIRIQRKFNSDIFKDFPNPKLKATQRKEKLTKSPKGTTALEPLRQSASLQCANKLEPAELSTSPGRYSPACNFPAKETLIASDAVSINNRHSVNIPSTLLNICRTEIIDCLKISSISWLDFESLFQSTTPTFGPSKQPTSQNQSTSGSAFASQEDFESSSGSSYTKCRSDIVYNPLTLKKLVLKTLVNRFTGGACMDCFETFESQNQPTPGPSAINRKACLENNPLTLKDIACNEIMNSIIPRPSGESLTSKVHKSIGPKTPSRFCTFYK